MPHINQTRFAPARTSMRNEHQIKTEIAFLETKLADAKKEQECILETNRIAHTLSAELREGLAEVVEFVTASASPEYERRPCSYPAPMMTKMRFNSRTLGDVTLVATQRRP